MILKHINLDKSFYVFLALVIIMGLFNNFVVYFLLLIIHEIGHTITGILLGYRLFNISIYPYGGITKFTSELNKPLIQELMVLLSGPIMQIIGYFILKIFIEYDYLEIYHYSLLAFNLLPIYPLDGGKLTSILCGYKFTYLNSFKITFSISIIGIIGLIIYNIYFFNINLVIMVVILIIKLITEIKNLNYTYEKFLLERYLYNYKFKNRKYINSIKGFYHGKSHVINLTNEKDYLRQYYNRNIDRYL